MENKKTEKKKMKRREEHISCKTIIETKLHITNKTLNIENRDWNGLAKIGIEMAQLQYIRADTIYI